MALTHASKKTTLWGNALIVLVGLIHLLVLPEYFGFATYLGLLFIPNALGHSLRRQGSTGERGGAGPGVAMAGGAFFVYVESRTIELPMLDEG